MDVPIRSETPNDPSTDRVVVEVDGTRSARHAVRRATSGSTDRT